MGKNFNHLKECAMILFKKIPYTLDDKKYEIRVLYDEAMINIVVFHNNYPANGFRHQVQIPKRYDVKKILKTKAIQEIIEIAKSDIIENRWAKLLNEISGK